MVLGEGWRMPTFDVINAPWLCRNQYMKIAENPLIPFSFQPIGTSAFELTIRGWPLDGLLRSICTTYDLLAC
jgi:hypothetical protein